MHADFKQIVYLAGQISKSGRWNATNEKLNSLAQTPGAHQAWWIQVIGGLLAKVFSEYLSLKRSFDEQGEPSLIAWRARNLLELSIWSHYCTKAETNARQLYEDAGRDEIGVYEGFVKWATATSKNAEFLKIFTEASQNLRVRALRDGISSLDEKFKQVGDAAKELGLGDHYKISNRMLSKFAHPTALGILSVIDEKTCQEQRKIFFGLGCLFFVGAFTALEIQLT